jgi:hypothetical protein
VTAASGVLSTASKKARLVRAFLGGDPVHCTWQLSPRCESFCHFCEHRADSAAEELDAGAWASVAAALGRSTSLLVSFTGSEPFLRDDLAAVVAAAAARHFPLLVTNGWLVTRARARAVWEAGLEAATVTLEDGLAPGHDAVTGVPGSHARAVRALESLAGERTRRAQHVNGGRGCAARTSAAREVLARVAPRSDVTVEPASPLDRTPAVVARLLELRRVTPPAQRRRPSRPWAGR